MDKFHFIVGKRIKKIMCKGLEKGLDMPHIMILKHIQKKGQCMVSDIANNSHITLSAVTNLVNRLVDLNLVTRDRSKTDRRVVLVELTDAGREQLSIVDENSKEMFDDMFSALTEDEVRNFFETIDKIITNFLAQEEIEEQEGIKKSS